MYELIAAVVIAISTIVAKAVKKAKARRAEAKLSSERYAQEGRTVSEAGWQAVNKGYQTNSHLLNTGYIEATARAKDEQQRQQDEAEFNQTILFLALGLAAVVVFPEPLTPASKMTAGFQADKSNSGGGINRLTNSSWSAFWRSSDLVIPS
mgnify:CR=1 FL=1